MIKISISENQPSLEIDRISEVFQLTGMSLEESDYYAEQTAEGVGFEIDAPDNPVVNTMVSSLTRLGVKLSVTRDSLQ